MRILFFLSIQVIFFNVIFIAAAQAVEGLPSQNARFQGMGSTLKEQKKRTLFSSTDAETIKAEKKPEAQEEKPGSYFKLHTFVINIRDERYPGKLLFLTLNVFCEIKDEDDKWLIETHIAPIKDVIITYTSGLFRQQIQTPKQKKHLQQTLTDKVKSRLYDLTGENVISRLYLTRIIIQ